MGWRGVGPGRLGSSASANTDGGYVLIATMLQPKATAGVSTHVVQVADLIAEKGQRVRIVTPQAFLPRAIRFLLLPGRVLGRVGSERAVRLNRNLHRRFLQIALQRQFRQEMPRLVYAQDPRSADAALKARRASPVPIVMVVHYNESQAEELVERKIIARDGTTDRAIRAFEEEVLPRLDGLVFVSKFMGDHLRFRQPALSGIPSAVVPNFVSASKNTPEEVATDRLMADCISVGSVVHRKNHIYLLRMLAAARDNGHRYSLTIVGDGPQRPALERLARLLDLDNQVRFAGVRHDVERLLARHRVYVHSSLMENCPFAIIEAMRGGLPIVAGAVGGIPEVVGVEGAGRFWDLAEPLTGARVLSELLSDDNEVGAAGNAARVRFDGVFAASVAGERLLRFLASIDRIREPALNCGRWDTTSGS
jgi:glycosyltransferase involved in cell wall biosynthesis